MNVFVLCTGRCGSKAFAQACEHITNYTVGHETRKSLLGDDRFSYPDNHIEIDNRLSWFLGGLHERYGDDPLFVHLTRDRDRVALSYNRRWKIRTGIVRAFWHGILNRLRGVNMRRPRDPEKAMQACYDMVDTINSNIRFFLGNKTNKMNFSIENAKDDLIIFWEAIQAEGDLESALAVFDTTAAIAEKSWLFYENRK